MKKILFLLTISISFFSCVLNDQQKAEKAVKDYLKTNLNNPKSYESVDFGKLVRNYVQFEETDESLSCLAKMKQLDDKIQLEKETYDKLQIDNIVWNSKKSKHGLTESNLRQKNNNEEYEKAKIQYNKKKSCYVKKQKGWAISHTFRGQNVYGAIITETKYFELNYEFIVEKEL